MSDERDSGTFWEHLDVLRGALLRSLGALGVLAVAAFCFKETLFSVVLAPRTSEFITFRLLGTESFAISLMNTGLTEQFIIHMKTAAYAGLLFASPYIIYELFRFVSPALYMSERRRTVEIVGASYGMFILGTLVNYFLVFPLTVKFLGTYQVAGDVTNMLTLQSYMDTLIGMSLMLGVVFELPVVTWLLSRFGVVDGTQMRQYRRHAVVAILAVSAIITPTTDAFTMLIVSLPIWMLYEISIFVAGNRKKKDE